MKFSTKILLLAASLAGLSLNARAEDRRARLHDKAASVYADSNFGVNDFFSEVVEEEAQAATAAKKESSASSVASAEASSSSSSSSPASAADKAAGDKPVFVSSNPADHITAPDEDPKVRINPEAPGPFIAMADAYQRGDRATAKLFARQFVRYINNLMFQVKEMTQLVGEAMVEEGTIEEEDWVGVEQYLDYEFAKARDENGSPVKPTHEEALKRIVADSKGEAEIYYFFTLNSSYSRHMAPDVERLWRLVKDDPKVKMVALTLGPMPREWISSYRQYTGLTIPILNGEEAAKALRIKFVPAIVIAAPNSKTAYFRTGQQPFARMYEFLRTVQGLPIEPTPEAKRLQALQIDVTFTFSITIPAKTFGESAPHCRSFAFPLRS